MRRSRLFLNLLLLFGMLFGLFLAEAPAYYQQLASNGTPLFPVVVKPGASVRVQAAATALAQKLSAITGGTFVVTTGNGLSGIAVGLGTDFSWPYSSSFNLTDPTQQEDFIVTSHANGVYVAGATDAAVEFAVWHLLHERGYRQFFPSANWEIIGFSPNLDINLSGRQHPDFVYRNIWFGYGTWAENTPLFEEWKKRNRVGLGVKLNTAHAYADIITRNIAQFNAHPEYRALVNGVRQGTKFCISNPDLRQLVVNDTLNRFSTFPTLQSVSLEPSDNFGWCECAPCAALGSISDRVVTLNNQVAEAVQAVYPDQKYLGMYAYAAHSSPPSINVNPRIVVSVATALSGFSATQLLDGWGAKGATLGVREYYSVTMWDKDLPGKAVAAYRNRILNTIPGYYAKGARFMNAESGDNWGPCGLGYYLASRRLWDSADSTDMVNDFLAKSFTPALKTPMAAFYNRIDWSGGGLLSEDLIGRMYRDLNQALGMTTDPKIRARIYDLALYTRYVELYFQYVSERTNMTTRQAKFEAVIRFAYRIRQSFMVHSLGIYRALDGLDDNVSIPAEAAYSVPEKNGQGVPVNPWKNPSTPYTTTEIDTFISQGIANNSLLPWTPKSFTDDLVPAGPLNLTSGALGGISTLRGGYNIYTWINPGSPMPASINFTAKTGAVYSNRGGAKFDLHPKNEPSGEMVFSTTIPPDRVVYSISLPTTYDSLHRIRLTDGTAGTNVYAPNPPNEIAFTMPASVDDGTLLVGRWNLYFYVPKGTTTIGGYNSSGSDGDLRDASNTVRHTWNATPPGYFTVPVPAGQDGKLWKFNNSLGERILMTVPPFLARSANQLLLPREVVEADTPTP